MSLAWAALGDHSHHGVRQPPKPGARPRMIRKILLPALAAAALFTAACGNDSPADSDPPVDLEATVEAQVAARLDAQATSQAAIDAGHPSHC